MKFVHIGAVLLLATAPFTAAQSVTDGRPEYTANITLPVAGEYRLELGDAGFPRAFASLTAGVFVGNDVIASLDMAGAVTFSTDETDITLRVIAQTQAPEVVGTATARVVRTDTDDAVFEWLDALEDAQPDGPGVAEAMSFELGTAQAVTIDLTDFAVPEMLADFDVIVLDQNNMVVERLAGPGLATVSLPAGPYRLFSAATADTDAAGGNGVFRVAIDAATDGMVIDDINVVGDDIEVQTVTLPAGEVTLSARDVGFPAALDTLAAALVGDDASLGVSLANPDATESVAGGTYQLFVFGGSQQPAGGTYSVNVQAGNETVAETVNVVSTDGATGPRLTEAFRVTTGGAYQLGVTDFRFPAALQALSTVVIGPDGLVTSLIGDGTASFDAVPGDYQVLVAAAGADGQDGLFGVTLSDPSGELVIESTAATTMGGETGSISAQAGERVTVTLSDIGFPAPFGSLSLAVTRGSETIGFVFGAGSFFFDVEEDGTYQYTLLAQPDAAAGAGLYDIAVSRAATPPPTPPAPPPAPPAPPNPGGSGGGGVFGPWLALMLLCRRRVSGTRGAADTRLSCH